MLGRRATGAAGVAHPVHEDHPAGDLGYVVAGEEVFFDLPLTVAVRRRRTDPFQVARRLASTQALVLVGGDMSRSPFRTAFVDLHFGCVAGENGHGSRAERQGRQQERRCKSAIQR